MPPRRVLIPVLAALALAAFAPSAQAAWFPSEAIDGPSADLVKIGGVDMARDGNGALVYIKREAGVPHVYLARFAGGAWQAPERVDAGIAAGASDASVAVGDGFKVMVLWTAGGRLFGSASGGGSAPAALTAPAELFNGGGGAELTGVDADMGINGTGYGVWSTPSGGGGGDVNAVRLFNGAFELIQAPVDINPASAAGVGAGRPRVAVSAEGNAVATWGEAGNVYGRRLTGLSLSQFAQRISLPDLNGIPGGAADSPDITIEYDGSYAWVAFRQDFGGVSRVLAKRLVGSQYESTTLLDLGAGGAAPRVAMTGRGAGLAAASAEGGLVAGAVLSNDAFGQPVSLGGGAVPPDPVVASDERDNGMVAWRRADGTIAARYKPAAKAFDGEASLASSALGSVGAGEYAAAGDRLGDFVVPMIQGSAAGRTLSAAVYDRPPGKPVGSSSSNYQRRSRPRLRWKAGTEVWGQAQFTVLVDGVAIGTTGNQSQLVSPVPVREGRHRWSVVATDRRGQQVASKERVLRIDSRRPRLRVSVRGARKRGRALRVVARASDPRGSGLRYVRVDYGDRSRATRRSRSSHRYRRAGRYRLVAKAVDKAGNVTRRSMRLRITR
jgi:hypothetical protein